MNMEKATFLKTELRAIWCNWIAACIPQSWPILRLISRRGRKPTESFGRYIFSNFLESFANIGGKRIRETKKTVSVYILKFRFPKSLS